MRQDYNSTFALHFHFHVAFGIATTFVEQHWNNTHLYPRRRQTQPRCRNNTDAGNSQRLRGVVMLAPTAMRMLAESSISSNNNHLRPGQNNSRRKRAKRAKTSPNHCRRPSWGLSLGVVSTVPVSQASFRNALCYCTSPRHRYTYIAVAK